MNSTRRLALSALFVSMMLILGYVEHLFPSPVPGVKLGLSNCVLLLAIYWLGVPNAFMLMASKVLLSGLLFGGVSSMLFSFAGGLVSMVAMTIVYHIKGVSPIGVGVVGGVMHNVAQIAIAMIIMEEPRLLYSMAILIVVGAVAGLATGSLTTVLMKRLPPSMRPKQPEKKTEPEPET